jgi:capsular polysaccharide export protein
MGSLRMRRPDRAPSPSPGAASPTAGDGAPSAGALAPHPGGPPAHLGALPARLHALGITPWKQPYLRLAFPQHEVVAVDDASRLPAGAAVLVWGAAPPALARHDGPVLRIEDGFLRSVGLGADLVRPLSWVIDRQALHFEAARPSDLEHLLMQPADAAARHDGAALREAIVAARLTKYNVGTTRWQPPAAARRVVLVAGQVESDASLALGAPGLRRNIALLRAAREAEPGAHLVYKIHPDVAARLRAAGQGEGEARRWADEVVADVPMADLLDAADAVHVMTSLAGFEALLRGKAVTCHGLPFYAGWGLTSDRLAVPARPGGAARRTRRLTLDELVAGALIRYPVYFSRDGARRLAPHEAVEALAGWRAAEGGSLPWWRLAQRVVLRRAVGVR